MPADCSNRPSLLRTAELSDEGVAPHIANFLLAREDGRLVAVAGLEDHGAVGLIRSVVTAPNHRSRGPAGRLVRVLVSRSRALGHQTLYLRTKTAETHFERFGFRRVAREEAALASGQFRRLRVFSLRSWLGGPGRGGAGLRAVPRRGV